jgi:hypothetical protein
MLNRRCLTEFQHEPLTAPAAVPGLTPAVQSDRLDDGDGDLFFESYHSSGYVLLPMELHFSEDCMWSKGTENGKLTILISRNEATMLMKTKETAS